MSEQIFEATLTPPRDLSNQMENRTLVIELDINLRPSDEMFAFTTSYKLHRRWNSWTDAESFCRNEGGQLASIHSELEQKLATEAAQGQRVWLGGRQRTGGQWYWADNTTWSFTNWTSGSPGSQEFLVMGWDGHWVDDDPTNGWLFFLCQGMYVAFTDGNVSTNIEGEKEQLAFFPFHLTFKKNAIN